MQTSNCGRAAGIHSLLSRALIDWRTTKGAATVVWSPAPTETRSKGVTTAVTGPHNSGVWIGKNKAGCQRRHQWRVNT